MVYIGILIYLNKKEEHYEKWKYYKEKNIKLITVWEDDWNYKQDIIKSIILNALNKISNKIYARKCEIKEIKNKRDFLNNNHIQGWCQSSINIGLYYKNELISLMTFGKRRKILGQISRENEYELLRFCSKINTSVVGGASKLFNYFIKTYNPNKIISYANCDISDGKMYEILKFENKGNTKINYWWAKERRFHRSNFMKHKLIKEGFDKNKSEDEIMTERGFYKIYGIGNIKYEWNKTKNTK